MNEKREPGLGVDGGDTSSSDPSITRKEFITKVLKGAAITGGVLLAPKVLDKFILPAQAGGASGSSCTVSDTKAIAELATNIGHSDVRTSGPTDTFCSG